MLWLPGDVARPISSAFVLQVCSVVVVAPMTSIGFTVPGGGCAGGAGGGDVEGNSISLKSKARSPSPDDREERDERDERDDQDGRDRALGGGSSSVGDSEMFKVVIVSPGWVEEGAFVLFWEVVARRNIDSSNELAVNLLDDRVRRERGACLSSQGMPPKASVGMSVL